MRKPLIIALGLASFGALSPGPASADSWRCVTHIFGQSNREGPGSNTYGAGWSIFGGHPQQCTHYLQDQPPKPTTPWQGSVAGYGTPIQQQKLKRMN
ncbi:MAG TPA: hypothetical protein VLU23_13850 [Pseudolabrys sp.]|jgi:hypothetical protein|nr:hypothetical protein [Pseudolabrys sp.]